MKQTWIVNVTIQSSWWICMRSSKQTGAYISSPVCTNRLIFSKRAFFILFFLNTLTNPIISQNLNFCDVTLHFSIGWKRSEWRSWKVSIFKLKHPFILQIQVWAIWLNRLHVSNFFQDPFLNFWNLFCLSVRINVKSKCFVRTTDGICCVFPFQYRGIEYTNCATSEGKSPKTHWCATQAGFDETRNGTGWGYCAGQ